jgi:hypothetical protein
MFYINRLQILLMLKKLGVQYVESDDVQ